MFRCSYSVSFHLPPFSMLVGNEIVRYIVNVAVRLDGEVMYRVWREERGVLFFRLLARGLFESLFMIGSLLRAQWCMCVCMHVCLCVCFMRTT